MTRFALERMFRLRMDLMPDSVPGLSRKPGRKPALGLGSIGRAGDAVVQCVLAVLFAEGLERRKDTSWDDKVNRTKMPLPSELPGLKYLF